MVVPAFAKFKDYEDYAKSHAVTGARNYQADYVLSSLYGPDNVLVEGTYAVSLRRDGQYQYAMNVVELRDEDTLRNTLREITVLKELGVHKYLFALYNVFRHRQYVALVFPMFLPLRNHLDVRYRCKHGNASGRFEEHNPRASEILQNWRTDRLKKQAGLFSPDTVAFVVKRVVKGLEYVHSRGFVHTEICADNVFIDRSNNVKLGGFQHAKRIESKSWKFTSDPNCHAPEIFDDEPDKHSIGPHLDSWSLGLLTLEVITGKRHYLKDGKAKRLGSEYLSGVRRPPSLGETDPSTLEQGQQRFDAHVDDFLNGLLDIEPQRRMSNKAALKHPFLARKVDKKEVRRELAISTDAFSGLEGVRNLFNEMFAAQGSGADLDEPFLMHVLQAIANVEKREFPIFRKVEDDVLLSKYIGIEASVAIPYDDSNWSRDVLDVSQRDDDDVEALEKELRYEAPEVDSDEEWEDEKYLRKSSRPQLNFKNSNAGHPGLNKDYQRHEMCFFFKKDWSARERQTFVAMQFGRWFLRDVIQFSDLIRVVDEVEEVVRDYVVKQTRLSDRPGDRAHAVYFASPLRQIRLDGAFHNDAASRYLQHIYVDVAIDKATNKAKLHKFRQLLEGDPVDMPEDRTTLQAAVCHQEVDPTQFEMLEAQMIGEMKVAGWEVDDEQRKADATLPECRLYKLLYERRRNYNRKFTSENDGQYSNQARCQKIWGDFTRDYLYKVCKWAVPYRVDQASSTLLYGDPFASKEQLDEAMRQVAPEEAHDLRHELLRTRLKQEEDTFDSFKRAEDVAERRAALAKHQADYKGQQGYFKLANQLDRVPVHIDKNTMKTPNKPVRKFKRNY